MLTRVGMADKRAARTMSPIPFNGSYDIIIISFVTDTNEPVATYSVRLRIRHLSPAFSVDLELTMINSNVILSPSFRFLVSTLFIHLIHVSIVTSGHIESFSSQSMMAVEPDFCPSSVARRSDTLVRPSEER